MSVFKTNKLLSLVFLISGISITSTSANAAWCLFDCKADVPRVEQKPAKAVKLDEDYKQKVFSEESQKALENLNNKMRTAFTEIEAKLQANQAEEAYAQAKSVLDEVKVITGIDPKARLQKRIQVSEEFAGSENYFSQLYLGQQERIIRELQDAQGGMFMDILNLTKRMTILFDQSLIMITTKHGGFLSKDRVKVISDIVRASVVIIPIEGKNGKIIYAYSDDVANEDHTYMFNRELNLFVNQNNSILNFSSSDLDSAIAALKKNPSIDLPETVSQIINQHIKDENEAKQEKQAYKDYAEKEKEIVKYKTQLANFNQCIDAADKIYANSTEIKLRLKNNAILHCIESEPIKNRSINGGSFCHEAANKMDTYGFVTYSDIIEKAHGLCSENMADQQKKIEEQQRQAVEQKRLEKEKFKEELENQRLLRTSGLGGFYKCIKKAVATGDKIKPYDCWLESINKLSKKDALKICIDKMSNYSSDVCNLLVI